MPTHQELLRLIAPCGMTCGTCSGYVRGSVVTYSRKLRQSLEGFASLAEQFASFRSVFRHYPAFEEVLRELAAGACEGCRSGAQPKPGCFVAPCVRSKGIDWCWQCDEFPCENVHYSARGREIWLSANQTMARIGVAAYWAQVSNLPHYASLVEQEGQRVLWMDD